MDSLLSDDMDDTQQVEPRRALSESRGVRLPELWVASCLEAIGQCHRGMYIHFRRIT